MDGEWTLLQRLSIQGFLHRANAVLRGQGGLGGLDTAQGQVLLLAGPPRTPLDSRTKAASWTAGCWWLRAVRSTAGDGRPLAGGMCVREGGLASPLVRHQPRLPSPVGRFKAGGLVAGQPCRPTSTPQTRLRLARSARLLDTLEETERQNLWQHQLHACTDSCEGQRGGERLARCRFPRSSCLRRTALVRTWALRVAKQF